MMFCLTRKTSQDEFGTFFYLGIIILLTAGVYSNSLNCPFIWDDQDLIVNNYLIRNLKEIPNVFITHLYYGGGKSSNYYRPLQTVSYMFDYRIGRLDVLTYHLQNIGLHILNSVLVFCLFSKFIPVLAAFITGLIFAVHPIHVEAVTYLSGRADLLAGFFMLFSLLLYVIYQNKKIKRFFVYSIFSFLLALLSKELALIFPLIILLFEKTFLKERLSEANNRIAKSIAIFLFVDLAYILWRFILFGDNSFNLPSAEYSLRIRTLFFLKAVIFYLKKLIFPTALTMSYTSVLPKNILDIWVLSSLLLLLLILAFLPYLYKKQKIIFFGIGWFFVFLLPQSNIFFPVNAFFADHFIYYSSIGFFLVFASLFTKYIFRNETNTSF